MDKVNVTDPYIAHIITYADTLYAIEAKYISVFGYSWCEGDATTNPYPNYTSALAFISDPGVCTDNVFKYLGLHRKGGFKYYQPDMSFDAVTGAVLYDEGHAIALFGNNGDDFGTATPVKNHMIVGGFAFDPKYYFVLED